MERISTVARDCSSRTASGWKLCLVCCLSLAASTLWSADPARLRPGQRPPRNLRQSQAATEQPQANAGDQSQLDDGFGQAQPASPGEATASASATANPLPAHVHPDHPLVPALKMAYASRATMSRVRDYTAQFVKKELVNGEYITHNMDMRFREQPFSVYLKFRAPNEGRQVLFVKGANNGQLLAREAGLKGLITVRLNPTDQLAMSENLHPITEIGISNMLGSVIRQWENEARYGEIEVKYHPDAKLGDYPVKVIITKHAKKFRQFKFHITRLYLDEKSLFPVRVEQFDWPQREGEPPTLVELYMYSGVRTNIPLSNADFDPRTYGL